MDCIVISHCRYKIAVTIHPMARHQCCISQAAAAQELTLVEEMENCAENQYSDKVKGYKSNFKPPVLTPPEESPFSRSQLTYYVLLIHPSLIRGQHQVVSCQEAQLSDIILFLICLLSEKSSTLQEHFALGNIAAIVYLVDKLRDDLQLQDFQCESFTDVSVLVNFPACIGRRVWVMKRSGEY